MSFVVTSDKIRRVLWTFDFAPYNQANMVDVDARRLAPRYATGPSAGASRSTQRPFARAA